MTHERDQLATHLTTHHRTPPDRAHNDNRRTHLLLHLNPCDHNHHPSHLRSGTLTEIDLRAIPTAPTYVQP